MEAKYEEKNLSKVHRRLFDEGTQIQLTLNGNER